MEYLHFIADFILHIDTHLSEMVAQYGIWVYAILFLIIFFLRSAVWKLKELRLQPELDR